MKRLGDEKEGWGVIGRDENCGAAPLFLSIAASSSHHVVCHTPLVWTHHSWCLYLAFSSQGLYIHRHTYTLGGIA